MFKKVALNVFVKMLNSREIDSLTKYFTLLDIDGIGMIGKTSLKQMFIKEDLEISDEEINDIFHEVEIIENDHIYYTEFMAATISND